MSQPKSRPMFARGAAAADDAVVLARFRKRYRLQDFCASVLRVVLALPALLMSRRAGNRPPRRILVVNAGHLGDAILSTCALEPLRHTYPGAEIGFLGGHQALAVLENHPLIDHLHTLDHWASARGRGGRAVKLCRYLVQAWRMRRELRAVGYDMAIDLHAWFPNYIVLLAVTGIPERIGTDRFGLSGLLTHQVPYGYARRHEVEGMRALLVAAGVPAQDAAGARPRLGPIGPGAYVEAARVVPAGRYCVLHPTASTPIRDWPIANWCALASHLLETGVTPVITGHGARDEANAAAILASVPEAVDAVGRLSWLVLGAVLSRSETIFCVETSVGHYARALGRPVVSIVGGMADPVRWSPLGAVTATEPQPCSPCFLKRGCDKRACLTGLKVETVIRLADFAKDIA